MEAVKIWHNAMKSKDASIWNELLDDDVVFHSPWFLRLKGKKITMMYLMAATGVFEHNKKSRLSESIQTESKFHYVNEIVGETSALLEFESEIEGTYINEPTCSNGTKITN